ncbi:hypothetical protein MXD63_33380 [Frankia sp. Cpl3]|uniref:hypothetical protein n=1 Tax=Parafrankia colletiae TaxID=573497 RepID=UPI001041D8C1|nr:hypothetical protein [Parafrankia colletiae]MCK9904911.1 hypothetical protein [Frankia sp. Cpl3]
MRSTFLDLAEWPDLAPNRAWPEYPVSPATASGRPGRRLALTVVRRLDPELVGPRGTGVPRATTATRGSMASSSAFSWPRARSS